MKTKDELYQKVRVTTAGCIKIEQDARTSCDQPSGSKMPWETGSNTLDYRIPGVPLSAVEQQDTHRKDKVRQLIEKFENHPNKESFIQGFQADEGDQRFQQEIAGSHR